MQTHYPLYERHATNKINYEEGSIEEVEGKAEFEKVVVVKGEVVIEAKFDADFTEKFSQMKQIKEY